MASGAEQKVADETIRDTLLDLAGYCVMTTMELDRQKENANQKAFEEQVRTEYADDSAKEDYISSFWWAFSTISSDSAKEDNTSNDGEKVVLHDDENGDIEVNVPEKVAKAKKPIDEGKVMALYNAKWSQAKIADEMGCSQGRISQIIRASKLEK